MGFVSEYTFIITHTHPKLIMRAKFAIQTHLKPI